MSVPTRRAFSLLRTTLPRTLSTLSTTARHAPSLARLSPRTFSTSPISALNRYADAKWTKSQPVTYEELKPITQSPDDVRSRTRERSADEEVGERELTPVVLLEQKVLLIGRQ